MRNPKHTLLVFGLGLGLAAFLPGCYAHAGGGVVYGEPVVYVDSPPERVESYPAADYHGHPAYYAEGRWYYRDDGRWVVFRDEPAQLREYRVRSVQGGGPGAERFREAPAPYAREAEDRRREQQRAEVRRADEQRRAEAQRRDERQRADAQRRADEQRRAEAQRMDDQRRAEAEQANRSREAARNAEARKRSTDKRDRQADDDDEHDPRAPRRRVLPN